jgi:excisionase family DNA binding protein
MLRDNYYSTTEFAKILGVSRITVFNMIKDGRIQAEKVGRNYLIPADSLGIDAEMTAAQKQKISKAVKKTVKEYGETLKLLANE